MFLPTPKRLIPGVSHVRWWVTSCLWGTCLVCQVKLSISWGSGSCLGQKSSVRPGRNSRAQISEMRKLKSRKVGSGEVRTHQRPPDSWPNGFLLYRSPKSAKYRRLNYCATKDSRLETSLIIPGHNP